MALIAVVVVAVYLSKYYENFEASLSAGPIKLDLKASNATTTLVICRSLSRRWPAKSNQ
jgi:hypothetical protein